MRGGGSERHSPKQIVSWLSSLHLHSLLSLSFILLLVIIVFLLWWLVLLPLYLHHLGVAEWSLKEKKALVKRLGGSEIMGLGLVEGGLSIYLKLIKFSAPQKKWLLLRWLRWAWHKSWNRCKKNPKSPRSVICCVHLAQWATYLVVSVSVEGDQGLGPEGVDAKGAEDNVGVVQLVVVRHPASNESPEGLHAWVGSKSSDLLWLATWEGDKKVSGWVGGVMGATRWNEKVGFCFSPSRSDYLPSLGYCQRFLGASLAVNGVYDFSYKFDIKWGIFINSILEIWKNTN